MKNLFSWRYLLFVGGLIGLICAAFFFRAPPAQSPPSKTSKGAVASNSTPSAGAPSPVAVARRFNVASVTQSSRPLNPVRVPSDDEGTNVSAVSDRPRFVAAQSNGSRKSVVTDPQLRTAATSLREYRIAFRQYPVGNNAEITRALLGKNPRGAKYLPADARLNGKGEMIDQWDQPVFFHQISGTVMEIRSAGPDHIMWNADDEALP